VVYSFQGEPGGVVFSFARDDRKGCKRHGAKGEDSKGGTNAG